MSVAGGGAGWHDGAMSVENHDLRGQRRDYRGDRLGDDLPDDPMPLFAAWFDQASAATEAGSSREPQAMTVSTVRQDADGSWRPRARVVLMKGFDARGLTFFTNYDSDKGQEIAANPWVSASFWWPEEARQVRFEGGIEKVARAESEEYFAQRPRGSQIGAVASDQSSPMATPDELARRTDEVTREYEGRDIPCPEFWGGYRITPDTVEFWQGQPSRLHDRVRYVREAQGWHTERLNP